MFTRKNDPVKLGADKIRVLGETLADQVETLTAKAGEQAEEMQAEWRKAERTLRDARKRIAKPAAEIADVARDLVGGFRKHITNVLR